MIRLLALPCSAALQIFEQDFAAVPCVKGLGRAVRMLCVPKPYVGHILQILQMLDCWTAKGPKPLKPTQTQSPRRIRRIGITKLGRAPRCAKGGVRATGALSGAEGVFGSSVGFHGFVACFG